MNKSIQLVTLPNGICAIHIETATKIEVMTLPSVEEAYECILNSNELCAMALENPMLDAMLTNLIAEI